MQVLLLGLFVAIYLHDATTTVEVTRNGKVAGIAEALPGDVWPGWSVWTVLLAVVGPKLLVGLGYWLACRWTRRTLGTAKGQRSLNRLEALTSALPLLLLCLFIVDLTAGALRHLRVPLQHTVLIDELLIMLPTLLAAVWAWAAYYPVDRRLREALIMRDADEGKPVYPLLSRGSYIAMQLRHQFGLLLLPLLAVFAWSEAVLLLGPNFDGPLDANTAQFLSFGGVLVIFVAAPLVIRYIWQTSPLPEGEVQDRMAALCRLHGVRVRELLLWQTSGRMINAAVTGLVHQVRFILLSDGLLDQLEPREIEAVMAHELAHVKCKHLIWMVLVVVALLGSLEQGGYALLDVLTGATQAPLTGSGDESVSWWSLNDPYMQIMLVSVPAFVIAVLAFGWVSRRIERQADVFAVQHLARTAEPGPDDAGSNDVFDDASVQTMVHALQRVAELNHAPIARKSWRHGSIAWRQDHLRSLIGKPLDDTPVDHVLLRVKLATMAGLILAIALYFV